MRTCLLLLMSALLLLTISCNSPSPKIIRPQIQNLVKAIAKDGVFKSSGVGFAGVKTDQWRRFEKLSSLATTEELEDLTDHNNSVVRCYAFVALADKKTIDLYPIVVKHLKDTAKVNTFIGCIVSSSRTGEFFLDNVNPEYSDSTGYRLTKTEMASIDSILIFDKSITLSAKYNLLTTLKPNSRYYNRLKELAVHENCPEATLALARFRNKNDIVIIKNLFRQERNETCAIHAAREFPDTSFYPLLVKVFENEWGKKLYDYQKWRILYQALAKYPTSKTIELFNRTIKCSDSFRRETLGADLIIAIRKYPNSLYKPFENKIKLDSFDLDAIKNGMNSED